MSSRTVSVEVLLMAACSMVAKRLLVGTGICTWPNILLHCATVRNIDLANGYLLAKT
jgi:hypothetical protein